MNYLNSYLEYLKVNNKYSDKTILSYRDDILEFFKVIEKDSINIDDTNVRIYLSYLYDKKFNRNSISRKLSSVRGFYNYLYNNDIINNNYLNDVHNPKKIRGLPNYLKECIAIENDDKIFNINDVTNINEVIGVPIVLDYHHYKCNKSEIDIKKIFDSWRWMTPKIHFSSPRNSRDYRSHAEYINSDDFIEFINEIKKYNRDVDVMIEAKGKDDALFRLVRELKYKTDYKFIDDTSFYI